MKVLAVGIHIDDCEYGAGGTLAMLADGGAEITVLNIKHYMHYKGKFPEADAQSMRSSEVLGAKKIILDYTDTKYYKNNEKTVRMTEEVICDTKPDIVFMMHPRDSHIEHEECAITTKEALFAAAVDGVSPNEIYTYECGPNQTMHFFKPDFYINVEKGEKKLRESLELFNVKNANGPGLWREKAVCAHYRGHASRFPIAEAFKILKYPTRNNSFLLMDALKDDFAWAGSGMYFPMWDLYTK